MDLSQLHAYKMQNTIIKADINHIRIQNNFVKVHMTNSADFAYCVAPYQLVLLSRTWLLNTDVFIIL